MSKNIQWPAPAKKGQIILAFSAAMLLAVMFVALTKGRPGGPTPSQSPSPGFTAGVVPMPAMSPECLVPGKIETWCISGMGDAAKEAIRCPHEDGNPNGQPCLWLDPDTRELYYVDSTQY